jgi:hypothetical protein
MRVAKSPQNSVILLVLLIACLLCSLSCNLDERLPDNGILGINPSTAKLINIEFDTKICSDLMTVNFGIGPIAKSSTGSVLGIDVVDSKLYEIFTENNRQYLIGEVLNLDLATSLCFSSSGNLYLLDDARRIHRLNQDDGAVIMTWLIDSPNGWTGMCFSPGYFVLPNGHIIDDHTLLLLRDQGSYSDIAAVEFNDNMAYTTTVIQLTEAMTAMTASWINNHLYLARKTNASIVAYDPQTSVSYDYVSSSCFELTGNDNLIDLAAY